MNDTILEIKDLRVLFPVHKKWLPAVDSVNLKIEKGEITSSWRIWFRKKCYVPDNSKTP